MLYSNLTLGAPHRLLGLAASTLLKDRIFRSAQTLGAIGVPLVVDQFDATKYSWRSVLNKSSDCWRYCAGIGVFLPVITPPWDVPDAVGSNYEFCLTRADCALQDASNLQIAWDAREPDYRTDGTPLAYPATVTVVPTNPARLSAGLEPAGGLGTLLAVANHWIPFPPDVIEKERNQPLVPPRPNAREVRWEPLLGVPYGAIGLGGRSRSPIGRVPGSAVSQELPATTQDQFFDSWYYCLTSDRMNPSRAEFVNGAYLVPLSAADFAALDAVSTQGV